jgi:hypothetical protein
MRGSRGISNVVLKRPRFVNGDVGRRCEVFELHSEIRATMEILATFAAG